MRHALVLLALLAGCREGTSVLVRIDRGDVVIPDDVAALHVLVTNPELGSTTFDSQVLPLCTSGAASGCYTFPLSVALRPGDDAADALVRADVTALDGAESVVIHDAAEFHFASGQQSTLDFVLSKACLQSACADSDQLCGRNGGCVAGELGSGGAPDLATSDAGVVERVALVEATVPTSGAFVLPRLSNAQPGDLIVGVVTNVPVPASWNVLFAQSFRQLVSHRVSANETDADYTFQAGQNGFTWALLSYRGASHLEIGAISSPSTTHGFDLSSMDVTTSGGILDTFIASNYPPMCVRDGSITEYEADCAGFDEQSVVAGPTGARHYDCSQGLDQYFAVELLVDP